MKRTIQATIIALLVVTAGVAAAADQATVAVTARVVGACKFINNTATLAFGDLPVDPSGTALGAGPLDGSLTFWCTKNATYTITDDNGKNESGTVYQMKSDTLVIAEYIPYSFTYLSPLSGSGQGPTNPITLNFRAQVGATYGSNSPDTYSDTVTIDIIP